MLASKAHNLVGLRLSGLASHLGFYCRSVGLQQELERVFEDLVCVDGRELDLARMLLPFITLVNIRWLSEPALHNGLGHVKFGEVRGQLELLSNHKRLRHIFLAVRILIQVCFDNLIEESSVGNLGIRFEVNWWDGQRRGHWHLVDEGFMDSSHLHIVRPPWH